jgi:hypothetical protein
MRSRIYLLICSTEKLGIYESGVPHDCYVILFSLTKRCISLTHGESLLYADSPEENEVIVVYENMP